MATRHATPETLDLAPEGRSGSRASSRLLPRPSPPPPGPAPTPGQHVAPHPGADPAGPTKAGGCHSRPHRPCPRGKAHTLAKGRSSACSTPCDGGEPAPLDTKGSPGSGEPAPGTTSVHQSGGQLALPRPTPPTRPRPPKGPPLTWLQVPRTPRGPAKGGTRRPRPLALQWVRRHEVGHSPPPQWPSRAGPGPHSHWLSGV